jgi:2'-5' RNA ligase
LERLHHDVEGVVRKLGFAPEKRAFAPHLTFARIRNPSGEYRSLESELKERDFGVSTIEAMALYQSVLKPSGAVYHRLKQFPFEGRRDDR